GASTLPPVSRPRGARGSLDLARLDRGRKKSAPRRPGWARLRRPRRALELAAGRPADRRRRPGRPRGPPRGIAAGLWRLDAPPPAPSGLRPREGAGGARCPCGGGEAAGRPGREDGTRRFPRVPWPRRVRRVASAHAEGGPALAAEGLA